MNDFLLGGVTVRPRLNQIESESACERLPAKFIDVLVALAEAPGVVRRKQDLIERVWGDPLVGDEALSNAIWVLRKALRDDARAPRFIETIPRRGYRLLLTPEWLDAIASNPEVVTPRTEETHPEPLPEPTPPHDASSAAPSTAALADAALAPEATEPASVPLAIAPPDEDRTPPLRHSPTTPRARAWLAAFGLAAVFALAALWWLRTSTATLLPSARQFRTGDAIASLTADAANGVLIGSEDGFLYALDHRGSERWRTPLNARWFSPPSIAGDALYVGSADGHIYALDRRSGREIWRRHINRNVRATPLVLADSLIVGDTDGLVQALARSDGHELWRAQFDGGDVVGPLLALGPHVLLSLEDGRVLALDPADGRQAWQQAFDEAVSDLIAIGPDTIVFTCESGHVFALAAHDGRRRWQIELDGAGSRPVFDGEWVYAVGRYGTALALRASDGQRRWQQQLEAGDRIDPALWGDDLVLGLAEHRLGLVNRERGELRRTLALPAALTHLVGDPRALWIATVDDRAYRIDASAFATDATALRVAADGRLLVQTYAPTTQATLESLRAGIDLPRIAWSARVIGNAQDATPAPDGTAYVGDERGVSAIDTHGRIRWRFALSQPTGTAPVIAGSRLLFGSRDHHVYALERETGRELWRYAAGADVISTPVVAGERVFVGGTDHRMHALRLEDGAPLWTFLVKGPINAGAAVADGRVVFGSGDSHVYALAAEDGRELWRFRAREWIVAQPIIVAGRVFVGAANGDFHALSLDDGSERWRFESDGKVWFAPAAASDLVYFGSGDGHIYALSQATGAERWRYRTGAGAEGSLVVRKGVLYAGSRDASLYALDARDGSPLWRLRTGGSVWNPGLARDTLLVPSADQHVYALGL